ncbi:hypothetical protein D3C87_1165900 [compost metagenome]
MPAFEDYLCELACDVIVQSSLVLPCIGLGQQVAQGVEAPLGGFIFGFEFVVAVSQALWPIGN